MSVKVMSLVWDHYPRGTGELILALALADWANDQGSSIFPSVAQMSAKTRLSERAVQYLLAKMRGCGWLQQISAGGIIGGRRRATTYRIPIELIPLGAVGRVQKLHPTPKLPTKLSTRVQSKTDMGATGDIDGCNGLHPNHHRTIIKPPRAGEKKRTRTPKPLREQSDAELITKALTLGIGTKGLKRDELVRAIEGKMQ